MGDGDATHLAGTGTRAGYSQAAGAALAARLAGTKARKAVLNMPYRDRVHIGAHHMKRFASEGIFPYTTPTVAISGTCSPNCLESEIVTGGQTIILTISQGKWVASGATFNAARQAIINGLDSAQAEATGWDAEVKAKQAVTIVVRTSDTIVTITLAASAAYSTTVSETITVTVPGAAMEGQWAPVVAGTFTVTTGS